MAASATSRYLLVNADMASGEAGKRGSEGGPGGREATYARRASIKSCGPEVASADAYGQAEVVLPNSFVALAGRRGRMVVDVRNGKLLPLCLRILGD